MITSYATDKDVKTAYIIKKKKQLEKLKKIFGTAETVYPALYVDIFGMPTPTSLKRKKALKSFGYQIINL